MGAAEGAAPSATPALTLIGLPSRGLERIAAGLGLPAAPEDPARFEQRSSGQALLVYRAPWRFLADRLAPSLEAAGRESSARRVLAEWHAYHAELSRLQRRHATRSLLINADRLPDIEALARVVESRLCVTTGKTYEQAGHELPPLRHETVYRHVVAALSPQSLELYAGLESRAELLGRAAEMDVVAGGAGALVAEVLELLAAQRAAHAESMALGAQLERVQGENALHLLQLEQIQDELERYFELDRAKAQRLAELASASLPRKLAGAFVAAAGRLGGHGRALRKQVALVRASGAFDESWYLKSYPDVAGTGGDPVEHYLRFGAAEGRNPSASFDTRHYLAEYPDVAAGGMNPLVHYIQFGRSEGREPTPDEG